MLRAVVPRRKNLNPPQGFMTICVHTSVAKNTEKAIRNFVPRNFFNGMYTLRRSQWSPGLRRRSAADRLLGLWVGIRRAALMSVSCECCVLSSRCLSFGLTTLPEVSYRLYRVSNERDREARRERP